MRSILVNCLSQFQFVLSARMCIYHTGVPLVMKELLNAGLLHGDCMTVTGKTVAVCVRTSFALLGGCLVVGVLVGLAM
jgi:hypothetical protein